MALNKSELIKRKWTWAVTEGTSVKYIVIAYHQLKNLMKSNDLEEDWQDDGEMD